MIPCTIFSLTSHPPSPMFSTVYKITSPKNTHLGPDQSPSVYLFGAQSLFIPTPSLPQDQSACLHAVASHHFDLSQLLLTLAPDRIVTLPVLHGYSPLQSHITSYSLGGLRRADLQGIAFEDLSSPSIPDRLQSLSTPRFFGAALSLPKRKEWFLSFPLSNILTYLFIELAVFHMLFTALRMLSGSLYQTLAAVISLYATSMALNERQQKQEVALFESTYTCLHNFAYANHPYLDLPLTHYTRLLKNNTLMEAYIPHWLTKIQESLQPAQRAPSPSPKPTSLLSSALIKIESLLQSLFQPLIFSFSPSLIESTPIAIATDAEKSCYNAHFRSIKSENAFCSSPKESGLGQRTLIFLDCAYLPVITPLLQSLEYEITPMSPHRSSKKRQEL